MATQVEGALSYAVSAKPIAFRPRRPLMAIGLACALIPLTMVLVVSSVEGAAIIPLAMRDVAASASLHSFTGVISNLGAFVWFAVAAICLLTRVLPQVGDDPRAASFLGWSSVLSLYLWFDDFFLFHERLAPEAGIPEKAVLLAFIVWIVVFLRKFRSEIWTRTNPWLLVSLALLAGSMAADVVLSKLFGGMKPWVLFVEDGFKWLGICAWGAFFFGYCRMWGARARGRDMASALPKRNPSVQLSR